jgi:hypothetical protein
MRTSRLIATHEAGHAVAAAVLGIRITAATASGVHTLHRRGDPDAHRREAIIAMAGPMAEHHHARMTGEDAARAWVTAWSGDLRNCLRHLDAAGGGPVAPVRAEAERLVRIYSVAIETVADALLARGRLSGDEIDRLL